MKVRKGAHLSFSVFDNLEEKKFHRSCKTQ